MREKRCAKTDLYVSQCAHCLGHSDPDVEGLAGEQVPYSDRGPDELIEDDPGFPRGSGHWKHHPLRLPPSAPGQRIGRTHRASFSSICPICRRQMSKGSPVVNTTVGYTHDACTPEE